MNAALIVVSVLLLIALVRATYRLWRLEASLDEMLQERSEAAVRDFKKRSARTRVGTTVEQMVPFVRELPYDPSDMRILSGGPVDYIVFDGLCDGELRDLVFLDIKTGNATLNKAQKQVRRCADEGRVGFATLTISAEGEVAHKGPQNARLAPAVGTDDFQVARGS